MKIYVGNLPFGVDESKLKDIFSDYETEEITVIKDKFNGRSKGFGFIVIPDEASAKKAIEEFNDKEVEGRQLKVSEAKPIDPDAPRPRRSFDGPRRSFGGNRDGGSRDGGQRRSFGGNRDGGQRRRF
jgi:RNA recognition motif-containing protein